MRKIVLLILLSVPLLLNSPLSIEAQPDNSQERRDPVVIYREAGATPEQEAKIRQLAQEYEKEAKVRVERLHNLSLQMKESSFEAELDEKKVLGMQDQINELQNVLASDRIKLMLKIRGLLNSDQRAKLVELLKARETHSAAKPGDKADPSAKAADASAKPTDAAAKTPADTAAKN